MSRLKATEFLPHAPKEVGAQVQVHHCKQGWGNDRLYIKRMSSSLVVAFCHHCGAKGYHKERRTTVERVRDALTVVPSSTDKPVTLPSDLECDLSKWPPEIRAWVTKYGVTRDDISQYGIGYSSKLGNCVLPIRNVETRSLAGYQERVFGSADLPTAPKYLTTIDKAARSVCFEGYPYWAIATDPSTCVLVEDVLSAIKVTRVPDVVGIAILGTTCREGVLAYLAGKYHNCVVWLDNDNPTVLECRHRLVRDASLLFRGKVGGVLGKADPKKYTVGEIKEELNKWLT